MDPLFAVGAPGLEALLALEAVELGLRRPRLFTGPDGAPGLVALDASKDALARANLLLRSADRVLARLGTFSAVSLPELRRASSRLPWDRVLAPGRALNVRVHGRGPGLDHERALAERLAGGAGERLKRAVALSKDDAAQAVVVRVSGASVVVDADASGTPLHRRGYRLETAKAPLKETLAAALLIASGWDRRGTLLDPFCGSGTIAVEAALWALRRPPGGARRFAFMDWPGFDAGAWERARSAASAVASGPFPRIIASDRDAGAVAAARANAERAAVADRIEFSVRALSDVAPTPGPGWLVTNPPYGVRVSAERDLRGLYARLGQVARALGCDWSTTVLTARPELARATGLDFDTELSTLNGGLPVRLYSRRAR
ncbi:MAG: hypothetical protein HKL90_15095 [Elusimicrobia bacterium]|nr:hypothetical protein [Elusimicrobiota bacterium]